MKPLRRREPVLDYVRLLADYGRSEKLAEYSEEALSRFGQCVVTEVREAVSAPHRVVGVRAEAIFLAVVAGLGKVKLIKSEDGADGFFQGDDLATPDFRIVRGDGTQLLVEVKSQKLRGSFRGALKVSDALIQRWKRYCVLTGAPLYFAVFWEELGAWTLNSVDAFHPGAPGRRRWTLNFMRAMATNEMATLGDCAVATTAPLRFRVVLDPTASEPLPEGGGVLQVTVAGIQLLSQDRVLEGLAARIAWKLMWFGKWVEWHQDHRVEEGKLVWVDHLVGPEMPDGKEPDPEQPSIVGNLSEMVSRAYLMGAKGTVHTTSQSELLSPGWMGGEFIPDDWVDMDLDISIWKFALQPNFDLWPEGSRPEEE